MTKSYPISKKRCVNCAHIRVVDPNDRDPEHRSLRCNLAKNPLYKNPPTGGSHVWIIDLSPRGVNVCSNWEELTPKKRMALRLTGVGELPVDPFKGKPYRKNYQPKHILYVYISADGQVHHITEEQVDAKMRTDKNTYTVQKL